MAIAAPLAVGAAAASAGTAATAATGIAAGAAAAGAASAGAAAATTGWLSSLLVGSAASAGSAATAGLFGMAGSATLGGILSGTFGLVSAASTILGASQAAKGSQAEGDFAKFQARQEEIAGKVEGNRIRQSMLQTMATQRARWGTAGIDLSSGTPLQASADAAGEGNLQLGLSRSDAATRAMARRLSSRQSFQRADQQRIAGGVEGVGTMIDFFSRTADRGMAA